MKGMGKESVGSPRVDKINLLSIQEETLKQHLRVVVVFNVEEFRAQSCRP